MLGEGECRLVCERLLVVYTGGDCVLPRDDEADVLELRAGICCRLTGAMVCTISLSCFTICFKISFSWLLKTPVLRSFWNFCSRIEFFFPSERGRGVSEAEVQGQSPALALCFSTHP